MPHKIGKRTKTQIIAGFRNAFGINTNYPTVVALAANEVGMDKYEANYNR